jgi:hypothetical protein
MRGDESLGTLLNLVGYLDMERTSYLSWARANDDELARDRVREEAESGGKPKSQSPTVETFEYTPEVELLAQLFPLTQQLIHAVHTHQTRAARRKPKITTYPTPRTAMARARKAVPREALGVLESILVFSDEPYEGTNKGQAEAGSSPDPQREKRPNRLR